MIVALRLIRRHSDKIGHHISFFLMVFPFDTKQVIITTHTNASSSSFVHLDILFDDNTLSQQDRGLMEDITRDPDDPDA